MNLIDPILIIYAFAGTGMVNHILKCISSHLQLNKGFTPALFHSCVLLFIFMFY